ncbi:hypothetical protein MACH09_46860 [Vibrio sp. MACH09]|uniref:hypothetical protein n=1 Tax=Vibrio sp. MACH09 TaxID=3025122 RepID=UPI00278F5FA9|nr:hypothetical protein [Vibrio sp. MACH09]GLO64178.1 hypothetical protein MACH09_46860 [Vibrio sp. MACH09]
MKRLYILLVTLCLSLPVWAKSPALNQLLSELNTQYSKTYTRGAKERDKKDVTKLAYFIQHIDEENTPEKLKLEAYLTGLHNGIYDSANMQRRMNAPNWFCMRDTMIMNPKRHPDFMNNLIWDVLEEIANENPTGFSRDNYASAFGSPINSVVEYGLQTRYPCFKKIPEQLQINGVWKY